MSHVINNNSETSKINLNAASGNNSSLYTYISQAISVWGVDNGADAQGSIHLLYILSQHNDQSGNPNDPYNAAVKQLNTDAMNGAYGNLASDLTSVINAPQPTFNTPDILNNAYIAILQEGLNLVEHNDPLNYSRMPFAYLDDLSTLLGTSFDPQNSAYTNAINQNGTFQQALFAYGNNPGSEPDEVALLEQVVQLQKIFEN